MDRYRIKNCEYTKRESTIVPKSESGLSLCFTQLVEHEHALEKDIEFDSVCIMHDYNHSSNNSCNVNFEEISKNGQWSYEEDHDRVSITNLSTHRIAVLVENEINQYVVHNDSRDYLLDRLSSRGADDKLFFQNGFVIIDPKCYHTFVKLWDSVYITLFK